MSDRSVQVTIGATLSGSFRTAFRNAAKEVRDFNSAISKMGASSGAGAAFSRMSRDIGKVGTQLRSIGSAGASFSSSIDRAANSMTRLGSAGSRIRGLSGSLNSAATATGRLASGANRAATAFNKMQSSATAAGRAATSAGSRGGGLGARARGGSNPAVAPGYGTRRSERSTGEMGVTAVGAGYSAMRLIKPSIDYDDAKNQLQTAYMDKNRNVDGGYGETLRQATELGKTLPGTAKDFIDIAIALKETGTSIAAINGGVLTAAAQMRTMMNMSSRDAGEFSNKLSEAMGISDADMVEGVNNIWKAKQAFGVKPEDMKATLTYGAPSLNMLGMKGLENSKTVMTMAGVLSQSTLDGSIGGTEIGNFIKELPGIKDTLGAKKNKGIKSSMDKAGIKLDFFDKKGNFKGFEGPDGVYKQMEQFRKLNPEERLQALQGIWGAQGMKMANVLVNQGEAGMAAAKAKQENASNLPDAIENRMKSTTFKAEQAGGATTQALADIGSTLKPALDPVLEAWAAAAEKISALSKEYPGATAAVAGFTAAALAAAATLATIGVAAKLGVPGAGAVLNGAGAVGGAIAAGATLPFFAGAAAVGGIGYGIHQIGKANEARYQGVAPGEQHNGGRAMRATANAEASARIAETRRQMEAMPPAAESAGSSSGNNFTSALGSALDGAVSKATEVANKIKSILNFSVSPSVNIQTPALPGAVKSTATAPGKQSSVTSSNVNIYAQKNHNERQIATLAAAQIDRNNRGRDRDMRSGTFDWVG